MKNFNLKKYYYKCPVCGHIRALNIFDAVKIRYCVNCGQYIPSIFGK